MVDLQRIKSIHITSQREVQFEFRNADSEVDFPSAWFEANATIKPTAVVPKYTGTMDDLTRAVKGGIRGANLTLATAKVFLHQHGLTMRTHLSEEWVSFERQIGVLGANITPWGQHNTVMRTMVRITEGVAHTPTEPVIPKAGLGHQAAPAPDDPNLWTDKALILYILGIYRLARVSNDEYADILEQRMGAQVIAEGGKGISFHGARTVYASWLSDRDFLKLVAAYDMFLYKFKDHPDAIFRMGTLGSRFRDCAGLLSMGFAMSILNIDAGDLMDWVFVRTMGNEVLRITTPGQESGKIDSYFPYQADLGLVTKSAYTSNANPYLFTWIHIIGSLIGHKRSQHARFIFEGSYADIGLNAVLVTWVFARGGDLTPQFDAAGRDHGADIEVGGDENDADGDASPDDGLWMDTQGRNPQTWYALLKTGGFKIPNVVKRAIKRQRDKIKDAREQTVGLYCKDQLIY